MTSISLPSGKISEAMDILNGLRVEIGFLSIAVTDAAPQTELRQRVNDIREIAARLDAALSVPTPVEPNRLLKDTLFALIKTGASTATYGGVLTEGGKKAYLRFTLEADSIPTPGTGGAVSDDLIERLRARTAVISELHHFSNPMTGNSDDAGLHTEAADALAAKDTALSEMKAELAEFDETNRQLVKRSDFWRGKAKTAEAELERVKKALRCIAEGNLGDASWQANYDKIRDVAARALAPSIQDEGGER